MRAVQRRVVVGATGQGVVTSGLGLAAGLAVPGWVVGVGFGLALNLLLAHSMAHHGSDRLGPADRVTLARAVLCGGAASLVADSFVGAVPMAILIALVVVALALDAVDGWVARRTGTASALGARFDGEIDAFLILVLSVYVARSTGAWVLAIGLARYAFLVAGWLLSWLRRATPPRYWRKVVAAVQGVVLAVAASGVIPGRVTTLALAAALMMLTESFGHDVWWLWTAREPVGDRGEYYERVGAA